MSALRRCGSPAGTRGRGSAVGHAARCARVGGGGVGGRHRTAKYWNSMGNRLHFQNCTGNV
eukprot:1125464-Prymnesium_polylepis.1